MATAKSQTAQAQWEPRAELEVLNTDIVRVDGPEKVTGRARYSHDIRLPNMVYAGLLVHPYPRSVVRAVDVDKARKVPGVVHAEALKSAGDDVRYRGISVGQVRSVELAGGMDGVIVTAALHSRAVDLARAGTRIWVVRPRVNYSGVAGLETIMGLRAADGAAREALSLWKQVLE